MDDLTASLAERRQPIWLVGEVTQDVVTVVATLDHVHVIDNVSGMRRAGQLARLAALNFTAGVEDDLRDLQPLYLRNP